MNKTNFKNFKESDIFVAAGLIKADHELNYSFSVSLSELSDVLDSLYEDDGSDRDEYEIPVDSESSIILDSPSVQFPVLGLESFTGVWMQKDESGEYAPDWSLTLIHKTGAPFEDGYYIEQDDIPSAMHNYLQMTGSTIPDTVPIQVNVSRAA